MATTIENLNTNITIKLSILQEIYEYYSSYEVQITDQTQLDNYMEGLVNLKIDYEFECISILNQYYKEQSDDKKRIQYSKFISMVHSNNIVSKLIIFHNFAKKLYSKYDFSDDCLYELFGKYDNIAIDITDSILGKTESRHCTCGAIFNIEAKNSEFVCLKCGSTEKLYGTVFEDEQLFYQEGQRTKHGKYDPTKHCKFWVDRIQAKESAEIPDTVINKIKSCIKRDKIWLECVTCPIIRDYLKEIKQTKYNDHVPLIRKYITGQEPPQFSDYELKLIYVYFSRVMQIYNRIKPDNKINSPYHPFFVYKIVEQILNKNDDSTRRNYILNSIHLQSRETVISHDNIWQKICEEIPEFIYIPTDCCK